MKNKLYRLVAACWVTAAFILAPIAAFAGETEFASPEPSMDEPRQIVISLNTSDDKKVNSILSNVVNIQKFYGQDNVMIAVVGWGPGVRPLLKPDTTVKARIESLMQYDIEFVACGNTIDFIKDRTVDDLIYGVEWVTAGLPEITERRLSGWVDLWPGGKH